MGLCPLLLEYCVNIFQVIDSVPSSGIIQGSLGVVYLQWQSFRPLCTRGQTAWLAFTPYAIHSDTMGQIVSSVKN